jgi:uncharacterized membrane protein
MVFVHGTISSDWLLLQSTQLGRDKSASRRLRPHTWSSDRELVAETSRMLAATLAEAKKHSLLPYQIESSLAIGGIELMTGQERSVQMRLLALEEESRAKGFARIANRVAAARRHYVTLLATNFD